MRSDNLKFKDIFWNSIGTITYSAVSLLVSIVIINISGSIEGGIFSFGFSTLGRLVYITSYFGIRPMHIVDIKYKYSFKDYISFGLKTAFIASIFGTVYIIYRYVNGNYTLIKSLLLFFLILHSVVDGLADYYECEYQRINKLFMCGQSLFFRIFAYTLTLVIAVYFTNNLLIAEVSALLVEIIIFYFLNIKRSEKIYKDAKLDSSKNKSLLFDSLPLFLITFIDIAIFSASKFSIDVNIGDIYSGFYNLIFLPTNGIYLIMTLFMKPILTPMSNAFHTDDIGYKSIIFKTFLLSIFIASFFILLVFVFGNYYLSIIDFVTNNVYINIGKEIVFNGYNIRFITLFIIIIGGFFYTISTPMYYALIIEEKQKYLLISYFIILGITYYMSNSFVKNAGLFGAATSFAISMFLIFVGVIVVKVISK